MLHARQSRLLPSYCFDVALSAFPLGMEFARLPGNDQSGSGTMKLQIERPHIAAMLQVFPRLAYVEEQLRFGNKVEIPFGNLNDEELAFLRGLYAEGGAELRARAAQIATLQQALRSGGRRFAPE